MKLSKKHQCQHQWFKIKKNYSSFIFCCPSCDVVKEIYDTGEVFLKKDKSAKWEDGKIEIFNQ